MVFYVFKQVEEDDTAAAGVRKTFLFASFTEGLARKTCNVNVYIGCVTWFSGDKVMVDSCRSVIRVNGATDIDAIVTRKTVAEIKAEVA